MATTGGVVSDVPDTSYPATAICWFSTILLAFLNWVALLDRTIIALMVEPLKQDLGISDVQFGMLHGLGFAIAFSLFGLVAGTLADRFSRRTIIFASVFIWSLATAACGMAQNFWSLLGARIGVGAGEAGLNPSATSVITDMFPPTRLNTALAVFTLGASVGSGFAYLFGGALIQMVSDADTIFLPLVGEVKPWQAVFLIIGAPGILIAFLSFAMPEPKRRGILNKPQSPSLFRSVLQGYTDFLKFVSKRKTFFFCHYVGFGVASMCFLGGSAWYPAHMGRTFGWNSAQIGLSFGIALIVGGFIGKFLTGFAIDALYARGYRDAQFRWFAGCLLIAVPVSFVALASSNPWVFLGGMTVFIVLLAPQLSVLIAALNLVTPNELRGAGVAFYSATMGLVALSLGPVMVAVFSDQLFGGNAIGLGIATLVAICAPLGAFTLLAGMRSMREAVRMAEEWSGS